MKRYLLDATLVTAYLRGLSGAVALIRPWINHNEAATSVVIYGEVMERFFSLPNIDQSRAILRALMHMVTPYPVNYGIMERYALIRRAIRVPMEIGLISDSDTIIAATAIENQLTLMTTDTDYQRIPNLSLQLLTLAQLR